MPPSRDLQCGYESHPTFNIFRGGGGEGKSGDNMEMIDRFRSSAVTPKFIPSRCCKGIIISYIPDFTIIYVFLIESETCID
jgi:hypothetical protein